MNSLADRIARRLLLDTKEEDKDALIMDLISILYRDMETGKLDPHNVWDQGTICRVADRIDETLEVRK